MPLSYFIEKPLRNWTRETAALIGTVVIPADYTMPIEPLCARLNEIVKASAPSPGALPHSRQEPVPGADAGQVSEMENRQTRAAS